MEGLHHRTNTATPIGRLLVILTVLSMINNTQINAGSAIGTLMLVILSLISIFACYIYVLKKQTIPMLFVSSIVLMLIFLSINVLGVLLKSDLRSLITIYQFVTVSCFFLMCSVIKWDGLRVNILFKIFSFIIFINFIIFILQGLPKGFTGIFNNPNLLGMLLFLSCFFIMLKFINKKTFLPALLLVMSTVLLYFSGTRSALIALAFSMITYFLWGIIKRKHLFTFYFLIVVGGIMSFSFIYPQSMSWPSVQRLGILVYEYTEKNLFSGRHIIWSHLFEAIKQKPWLGYGTGTLPSDILTTTFSAHNLYIQIALQVGLVGLGIFLLLLLSIWKMFWSGRNDKRVRLSAAFFIGILIQQAFEVTLIQNNLSVGIIQWFVIAIGISASYQINRESYLKQQEEKASALQKIRNEILITKH